MSKRFLIFLGIIFILLTFSVTLFAEEGAGGSGSLTDLVKRIGAANNSELAALNFFELNILKNSIFSTKGYQYADDRSWLFVYFYEPQKESKSVLNSIFKDKWDLREYTFPKPKKNNAFRIDKDMEKAIANVQVALYKKIRSFKNSNAMDEEITRELKAYQKNEKQFIFGRELINIEEFGYSIRREAHGYKCVTDIIDSGRNFDACELLGVYVGSVAFLKNVIEAKNGKIFSGLTSWEISQIVGVTPKDTKYDQEKLPPKIKAQVQMLDSVIQKMTRSGIGDVPEELKNGADLSIEVEYIQNFVGC